MTDAALPDLKTSLMGGNGRASAAASSTSGVKYSQGTTTPAQPPSEPLAAMDTHASATLTPDQAMVNRTEAKLSSSASRKRACSDTKAHLIYGRGGSKTKGGKKRKSGSGSSGGKRSNGGKGKKGSKKTGAKGGKKGKGTKGTRGKGSKSKSSKTKKSVKGKTGKRKTAKGKK